MLHTPYILIPKNPNPETQNQQVKYPRVEEYFRSDMKIIKDFCSLAMRQHLPALREIEKQFMSEFDFTREAKSMERVAGMLNKHPKWGKRVHVPQPSISLCTPDVLVMELLDGVLLEEGIRSSMRAVAEARGTTPELLEEEHQARIRERGLRAAPLDDALVRLYIAASFCLDCMRNMPILAFNTLLAPLGLAKARDYKWTPAPVNLAATLQVWTSNFTILRPENPKNRNKYGPEIHDHRQETQGPASQES